MDINRLTGGSIMDDYILQREYVAAEYSYDGWYPAHYVTKKGEEVVRCHNCQRFKPFPIEQTQGNCRWLKVPVSYMDFCSHAIKKKIDL